MGWEEVGPTRRPQWEGTVEDSLVAGTQISFLDLAEYYSRNQVCSLTSGIPPGLKKKNNFLTENQQLNPRKHEGLFLGLLFNEAKIIFKGNTALGFLFV